MSEAVAAIVAARFHDAVDLFRTPSRRIAGEWKGESYLLHKGSVDDTEYEQARPPDLEYVKILEALVNRLWLSIILGSFSVILALRVIQGSSTSSGLESVASDDASSQQSFALVGQLSGTFEAVAVHNGYIYLGDPHLDNNDQLHVVNALTPTRLISVGSVSLAGNQAYDGILGIAISGEHAYIANGSAGLQVVDISTPVSLSVVGQVDTPGFARGVVVSGSYAFVADNEEGLQVVDVSHPSTPTIVFSYPVVTAGAAARDVTVDHNYAYVAVGHGVLTSTLLVLNAGHLPTLTLISTYEVRGMMNAVESEYPYVYAPCSSVPSGGAVSIIDVTNPVTPTEVGFYAGPGCTDVGALDSHAYLVCPGPDGWGGTVIALNISNPTAPTPDWAHGMQRPKCLAVTNAHIYATGGSPFRQDGLHVLALLNQAVYLPYIQK